MKLQIDIFGNGATVLTVVSHLPTGGFFFRIEDERSAVYVKYYLTPEEAKEVGQLLLGSQ